MMTVPTFKDLVQNELAVFFNLDEFAEIHNIDGRDMPAVVDKDLLQERPRQPMELYLASEGVYIDQILVFVRTSDFGDPPVIGQHIHLDGELYRVSKCAENAGIIEITLEANRA